MRKLASFLVVAWLCAVPAFGAAESYKDVPVVDVNCSKKVAADPDSHPRADAAARGARDAGGMNIYLINALLVIRQIREHQLHAGPVPPGVTRPVS